MRRVDQTPAVGQDRGDTVTPEARAAAAAGRRRTRLLLRTAPVLLLVLLFSVKTLSMVAVNESGRGAYAAGDHPGAESRFARLGVLNLFQWWIAPYNQGTALYQTGDLDGAVEQLGVALGRAPQDKKCQVATNLARVHEAQGDQLVSQGRQADAQERYAAALRVLADNRCTGPEGDGSGDDEQQQEQQEKQQRAEERVGEKLEESENQPEGEPGEDQDGDPQEQPERTPQEDQRRSEEQKQRNGEGQRQEQNRREMEDAEQEPERERADKPW